MAERWSERLYKDLFCVLAAHTGARQALVMFMDYKVNYQLQVGIAYDYGMDGIK